MTTPPTRQGQPPLLDSAWAKRPPLVGAMFNPALITCLLASTINGYSGGRSSEGMPWMLSYIAAPLVLHRSTREALPTGARARTSHLGAWVQEHPLLRAGFPSRAQALVTPVRAGLRFGLRHQVLGLTDDRLQTRLRWQRPQLQHPELDDIINCARNAGRWLSSVDTASAFSLLGVAP
ncbi:three component ABC system middle component [Streptomyces sp. NPDC087228]|uniref:three component ABC system middle component n=1 Tax=Streptomyces sp. NPDC087228 TaxID=3365772 RepID=UPI003828BDC2